MREFPFRASITKWVLAHQSIQQLLGTAVILLITTPNLMAEIPIADSTESVVPIRIAGVNALTGCSSHEIGDVAGFGVAVHDCKIPGENIFKVPAAVDPPQSLTTFFDTFIEIVNNIPLRIIFRYPFYFVIELVPDGSNSDGTSNWVPKGANPFQIRRFVYKTFYKYGYVHFIGLSDENYYFFRHGRLVMVRLGNNAINVSYDASGRLVSFEDKDGNKRAFLPTGSSQIFIDMGPATSPTKMFGIYFGSTNRIESVVQYLRDVYITGDVSPVYLKSFHYLPGSIGSLGAICGPTLWASSDNLLGQNQYFLRPACNKDRDPKIPQDVTVLKTLPFAQGQQNGATLLYDYISPFVIAVSNYLGYTKYTYENSFDVKRPIQITNGVTTLSLVYGNSNPSAALYLPLYPTKLITEILPKTTGVPLNFSREIEYVGSGSVGFPLRFYKGRKLVMENRYTPRGQVESSVNHRLGTDYTATYDSAGKLSTAIFSGGGLGYELKYDSYSFVRQVIENWATVVSRTNDSLGRPLEIIDSAGNSTKITYDIKEECKGVSKTITFGNGDVMRTTCEPTKSDTTYKTTAAFGDNGSTAVNSELWEQRWLSSSQFKNSWGQEERWYPLSHATIPGDGTSWSTELTIPGLKESHSDPSTWRDYDGKTTINGTVKSTFFEKSNFAPVIAPR